MLFHDIAPLPVLCSNWVRAGFSPEKTADKNSAAVKPRVRMMFIFYKSHTRVCKV